MKKLHSLLTLLLLTFTSAYSDTAVLVKDIVPGASGSNPGNLVDVNGTLFFTASNAVNGVELWKSDGTDAGTMMVKDINAGANSSNPSSLINVNGKLFFTANDGLNGPALWRSDGTAAGTIVVSTIHPSSGQVNVNGTLFFGAFDPLVGRELWKSDGTTLGTVLVKDINPGTDSSEPSNLVNVGGTVFFTAYNGNGIGDLKLWKSDGTDTGTVLLKSGPDFYDFVSVNGTLFFADYDDIHGFELWKSDGTAAGTVIVKDINPGGGNSTPDSLVNVNGTLFFSATSETLDRGLWRSDGTESGTWQISTRTNLSPNYLVNVSGTLFFVGYDLTDGYGLWKSDGTGAGTVVVKHITSAAWSLLSAGGKLFFTDNAGTNGLELWESDGTAAGTVMVKDINPGMNSSSPGNLTSVNGVLFFTANDGSNGVELWKVVLTHTLTLLTNGAGSVTRAPDQVTYVSNSVAQLTATPEPGWGFLNWSGDAFGSDNPLSVRMTADKTITANFYQPTINVTIAGSGVVLRNSSGPTYPFNSTVTLTAVPNAGWVFTGWSGDAGGGNNSLVLLMSSNKNITATFTLTVPDLIVDNTNAAFTGSWTTDTGTSGSGFFAQDFRYATSKSTADATATFTPNLPLTGNYDVYVWYPTINPVGRRCSDVQYLVSYDGGFEVVHVDQFDTAGGRWQIIESEKLFLKGTNEFVRLSNFSSDVGRYVPADAVRWSWSTNQPPQPYITSVSRGGGSVTLSWLAGSNQNYRVEYKTNLNESTWHALLPDVLSSGNGATNVDSTLGNAPQRFYRVQLLR